MSATSRRLRLQITSDPARLCETRRRVEAFAGECGFDPQTCGNIGLCVNEALANVIRHAYAGATDRAIEIEAEEAEGMRIRVRDWGCGVDPQSVPQPDFDPLRPGGLGMLCLRKLMDEVIFERQPDGMLLTLHKHRSR